MVRLQSSDPLMVRLQSSDPLMVRLQSSEPLMVRLQSSDPLMVRLQSSDPLMVRLQSSEPLMVRLQSSEPLMVRLQSSDPLMVRLHPSWAMNFACGVGVPSGTFKVFQYAQCTTWFYEATSSCADQTLYDIKLFMISNYADETAGNEIKYTKCANTSVQTASIVI
ncbi:hypothetical protein M8J75_004877 [Diaphorina citri]|nr:hypothetical protein M8J75_004877 [Diaphorina citri]